MVEKKIIKKIQQRIGSKSKIAQNEALCLTLQSRPSALAGSASPAPLSTFLYNESSSQKVSSLSTFSDQKPY